MTGYIFFLNNDGYICFDELGLYTYIKNVRVIFIQKLILPKQTNFIFFCQVELTQFNCGEVGCSWFEPQRLHIICNIPTN